MRQATDMSARQLTERRTQRPDELLLRASHGRATALTEGMLPLDVLLTRMRAELLPNGPPILLCPKGNEGMSERRHISRLWPLRPDLSSWPAPAQGRQSRPRSDTA